MNEREEAIRRQKEREKRRRLMQKRREQQIRKQKMMLALAGLVVIIAIIIGIVTAVNRAKTKKEEERLAAEQEQKLQEQLALEAEIEANTVHLLAVGDNILHDSIVESGKSDTGAWSYDHLYQYLKDDIQEVDISVVTQETILVESKDDVAGYPNFGTPYEAGTALVNTGFDVVAHATNHTWDKGMSVVTFTKNWWNTNYPEVKVLGIHESSEDANEITVVESKNIKIAFLNYTYALNEEPDLTGYEYMVDVFEEASAREDIKRAKSLADVVVVVAHMGIEYDMDIDDYTQYMTNIFLEEGVDVVIGSHPHVVRKMETLTGTDGHQMLIYYSLGNFISTQKELPSLLGAMAKIDIARDIDTGEIEISSQGFTPLMTHYDHENKEYAVYKLSEYTEELAAKHSAAAENPLEFSIDYYEQLFNEIQNK